MRLSLRHAFVVFVALTVLQAVNGVLRIERERELFQGDRMRDSTVYGTTLADVVAREWQAKGEAAARRLIRDRAHPQTLQVDIVLAGAEGAPLAAGVEHELGPAALVTYVPIQGTGGRPALLRITESRDVEEAFVAESIQRTVVSTVVIAAASGVLLVVLGAYTVGRPVRRLVELARRAGAGSLEVRAEVHRTDELGLLAGELNTMWARLAAARDEVARETARRIGAVEQLRHADRLATVGTLAAGVAHELGTPLNVVAGRARQIETRELPRERVVANAHAIGEQVARMTRIIRGLLDFSRRTGGTRSVLELAALARRTLEVLGRLPDRRAVELRLDEPTAPVWVEGDPTQLEQVLTNLVINGLQAMPAGGALAVDVGRAAARHPTRGVDGEWARLAVRDTGAGIAEEHRGRVFEPFFTTKDVGEGTGLGLSVAHGIVAEHGGWIDLTSEVGRGTTFTVFLPLAEVPALTAA